MQEMPLISIIMPTYNCAPFIKEAIQSVINQTYTHWELIIIDDASTDKTCDIVKGMSDARIHYILLNKQQGHPSRVRNIGLQAARGCFIGFLDADDVFYPPALTLLYQALNAHPGWLIAQGYETYFVENCDNIKTNPALTITEKGEWQFTQAHQPASLKALLRCKNPYLLGATLMRRQALERIGLFNESLMSGEDQEYFIRAYLASGNSDTCQPIGIIPAPIYKYRQHQNSLVRNIDKKDQAIHDNIRLLDWLFDPIHQLPAEILQLQGEIYSNRYAYAAQALLMEGYYEHAKSWVLQAWKSPRSSKLVWVRKLLPVLIRCALPLKVNQGWQQFHEWGRTAFYGAISGHA